MVIMCGHAAWRKATPESLKAMSNGAAHRFGFFEDEEHIGELPTEWNWLVGEYPFNPAAKIVHFSLGIPGFAHYFGVDYADEWRATLARSQEGLQSLDKQIAKSRLKVSAR